jgi:hypothetical protein
MIFDNITGITYNTVEDLRAARAKDPETLAALAELAEKQFEDFAASNPKISALSRSAWESAQAAKYPKRDAPGE